MARGTHGGSRAAQAAVLAIVAVCATVCTPVTAQSAVEMASIDFMNLLANPMMALVDAQIRSADTTLSYMLNAGAEVDADGNFIAKTVPFRYDTLTELGANTMEDLHVPVLCLIPIPYIRIDKATFEFNMKLASSFASKMDMTTGFEIGGSIAPFLGVVIGAAIGSAGAGIGAAPASMLGGLIATVAMPQLSGTISVQSQVSTEHTDTRAFSMRVAAQMESVDLPPGVTRLMERMSASAARTDKKK